MYHAKLDSWSPYAPAKATAEAWCAKGVQITFSTDVGLIGHIELEKFVPNSTAWLEDRLNGIPVPPGCTFKNIRTPGIPFLK